MKKIAIFIVVSICFSNVSGALAATSSAKNLHVVSQLIHSLQQPAVAPRLAALKALGQLGPAAAGAVPSIIDLLNENRAGATSGVGLGKPISPALTDAALQTLSQIGPAAHDAAPYVTPLLKDRNELLRRPLVLQTLNSIGPSSDSGAILIRVVGEEGKFTPTRAVAIEVLGKVEPPAVEACDMLREISEDATDSRCRVVAKKALNSIVERSQAISKANANSENGTELQTLRLQLSSNTDTDTRVEALDQITELGPKAATLVPLLMQTAGDRDVRVRHAALSALAAIGSPAVVAVPSLLTKFLSQPDQNERGYYRRAISKIDSSGRRTIPLLQEALDDPFKARLAIELLNELGTDQSTTLAQKARQRWRIRD